MASFSLAATPVKASLKPLQCSCASASAACTAPEASERSLACKSALSATRCYGCRLTQLDCSRLLAQVGMSRDALVHQRTVQSPGVVQQKLKVGAPLQARLVVKACARGDKRSAGPLQRASRSVIVPGNRMKSVEPSSSRCVCSRWIQSSSEQSLAAQTGDCGPRCHAECATDLPARRKGQGPAARRICRSRCE